MLVRLAFWILSIAMRKDPHYAWGWHCNIAMVAQDAGAFHFQANKCAAQFMKNTFDVDTSEQFERRFK